MDLLKVYKEKVGLETNLTNLIAACLNVKPKDITVGSMSSHREKEIYPKMRFIPVWFNTGDSIIIKQS